MSNQIKHLDGKTNFRLIHMQFALGFLLDQLGRAGNSDFNDVIFERDYLLQNKYHPKDYEHSNATGVSLYNAKKIICREDGYGIMDMDIGSLDKALRVDHDDVEIYTTYFMEFKALYSVFNSIKPFYESVMPTPIHGTLDIGTDKSKWVDLISDQIDLRKRHNSDKLKCCELSKDQPAEEAKIMPILLKLFEPKFREKLKRAKEQLRKRAKEKAKHCQKQEETLVEAEVVSVEEQPIIDSPVAIIIDTAPFQEADQSAVGHEEKKVSLDDESLICEDYTVWITRQRELSLAKKAAVANEKSTKTAVERATAPKISLDGGAKRIYLTAIGAERHLTTKRDLMQFLNQVNGSFVKCTGPHSDPKIALPNHSPNATQDFLIGKMHLMHSGAETFPPNRLKTFLGRMIEEAGLKNIIE